MIPAELRRPDVRAALVEALRRAYEVNQDWYDTAAGHDSMLFGQSIWKSGSHYVKGALDGLPECHAVYSEQSLDIRIGRCQLRLHKLGNSSEDDPRYCFPNHAGPAARMAEQLELQIALSGEPEEYVAWVIGSYGNPTDGLCAVRLQAVGSARALDGTMKSWSQIETIFDVAEGASTPLVTARTAEPVIAPEPAVALRRSGEEGEDRGQAGS